MSYPGDPWPVVVHHPGRCGGAPTIGQSRLPVADVFATYWHHGMVEVEAMWDDLRPADMMVCAWYLARYGTRSWRTRLRPWLEANEMRLYSPTLAGQPDMPPTAPTL